MKNISKFNGANISNRRNAKIFNKKLKNKESGNTAREKSLEKY